MRTTRDRIVWLRTISAHAATAGQRVLRVGDVPRPTKIALFSARYTTAGGAEGTSQCLQTSQGSALTRGTSCNLGSSHGGLLVQISRTIFLELLLADRDEVPVRELITT